MQRGSFNATCVSVGRKQKNENKTINNNICISCGRNHHGQLGHSGTEERSVPMEVTALASQHVVSVAAADLFSLAITAGGEMLHWGLRFESLEVYNEEEQEHQTQPARLWSCPAVAAGSGASTSSR